MTNDKKNQPEWVTKGKSIRQLIEELKTFENQEMEVQMSFDEGETRKPISILVNREGYCLLLNSEALGDDA
jgi:formyltetrahydrofolate hydrolase